MGRHRGCYWPTGALVVLGFLLCRPAKSQQVVCRTTAGDLHISLHKEWAPLAHARFMALLSANFFEDQLIQTDTDAQSLTIGVVADPALPRWHDAFHAFPDDITQRGGEGRGYNSEGRVAKVKTGFVSFFAKQPNTRATGIMIAYGIEGSGRAALPYERPVGRVTNTELLPEMYRSHQTETQVKISDCAVQLSKLQQVIKQKETKAEVANQLGNIKLNAANTRKENMGRPGFNDAAAAIDPSKPQDAMTSTAYWGDQIVRCVPTALATPTVSLNFC